MPDQVRVIVCQRCGRGFVLTRTYCDYLTRWGIEVVVPVLCPTCFIKTGPLPKQRGEVKWFSPRKHYGFIVTGEGDQIFFHQRQILGGDEAGAREGQGVLFHVRDTAKGPEALNVELREE